MIYNQFAILKLMNSEDPAELIQLFDYQAENNVILQGLPTYQEIQKINGNQRPTAYANDQLYNQNGNNAELDEIQSSPQSDSEQYYSETIQLQQQQQQQTPTKNIRKNKKRKLTKKTKRIHTQLNSETKNIPKNYGKQIVKFIKSQRKITQQVLKNYNSKLSYTGLVNELKTIKKKFNKISDLRRLWLDYGYSKQMRVLSGIFLRKYSLSWIFNSRIENVKYPIKYRYRIVEGVRKPQDFLYLKDF